MKSHAKFKASLDLPFSLLADTKGEGVRLYDALMRLPLLTIAARKIVLINRDGKIVYRDDKYDLSSDEALNSLKAAVLALE